MAQQTYEGRSLEELLAQVHQELGERVTIAAANKVRSGGVGGFFTRERYQLIVEVPDRDGVTGAGNARPAPAAPPVAPVEAAERRSRWGRRAVKNATGATPDAASIAAASATTRTGPGTVAPVEEPPIQESESLTIEALLAMADLVSAEERIEARALDEGFAGAMRRAVAVVDDPQPLAIALPAVQQLPARPASSLRPRPAPIVTREQERFDDEDASVVGDERELFEDEDAVVDEEDATFGFEGRLQRRRVHVQPAARPSAATPVGSVPVGSVPLERLVHLATPEETDPPEGHAVVAVVGPFEAARSLALVIQRRAGIAHGNVIVASKQRPAGVATIHHVADAAQIAQRRARWISRPVPVFVAVAVEDLDDPWLATTVAALGAAQVRLVVEAWRPMDDVERTIEALPFVDVLDIVDVEDTTDPLALARLGIPVGTLDGRPADADRWAAVLERIRLRPAMSIDLTEKTAGRV